MQFWSGRIFGQSRGETYGFLEATIGMGDDPDWETLPIEELFPLVYKELRRLAARERSRDQAGQSIQPTSLVHEAFLKFHRGKQNRFKNRAHFLSIAGRVMRQVLVDRARAQLAIKRGERPVKKELSDDIGSVAHSSPELTIAVHEALKTFTTLFPRRGPTVELLYFGGLSQDEVAEALGISLSKVKADWTFAKPWFQRELT